MRLPRDQPPAIWQLYQGDPPQVVATLAVALDKRRAPRRSGLGEDHVDLEVSRPVLALIDIGVIPLLWALGWRRCHLQLSQVEGHKLVPGVA